MKCHSNALQMVCVWAALAAPIAVSGQASAETIEVAVPEFDNAPYRRVVVGATDGLELGQRVRLEGNGVLVNLGPEVARIQSNMALSGLYSEGPVEVFGAEIAGSLFTESEVRLFNNASVQGVVIEHTSLGRGQSAMLSVEVPEDTAGSIDVQPDSTVVLPPGRWETVAVKPRGRLVLTSGTYAISNWVSPESDSSIEVDDTQGPVLVVVLDSMFYRAKTVGSSVAPRLHVVYLGENEVFLESAFRGALVAPDANLTLGGATFGQPLQGAFFGKRVIIRPDTAIQFVPSDMFGAPRASAGPTSDAVEPIASAPPSALGCGPRLQATGLHEGADGEPTWERIEYVDSDCPDQQKFCNSEGEVIPDPSEAQLNAAPDPGESCSAFGAHSGACPVDPSTVGGECSTDIDCATGEVCAEVCASPTCASTVRACGRPYESCASLPLEESDCQSEAIYECPNEGFTGALNLSEAIESIPTTSALPDTFDIPPEEQVQIQPFESAASGFCSAPSRPFEELSVVTAADRNEGSPMIGFGFETISDVKSNLGLKEFFGEGDFSLSTEFGVKAVFNAFGNKLDIFSAAVGAGVEPCGWAFDVPVKLFGERIDVTSLLSFDSESPPSLGDTWFQPKADGSIETPDFGNPACNAEFEERDDNASGAHKALFAAKNVREFFLEHGATVDLCERTNFELGTDYNCLDPAVLQEQGANVANAWVDDYRRKSETFFRAQAALDAKKQNYSTALRARLYDVGADYTLLAAQASIPVAFFQVQLSAEAFGGWGMVGEMQAGLDYSGGLPFADMFTQDDVEQPFIPLNGDLGFFAGPVITPGVHLTTLAFAGVGIPGVSIGIEGLVKVVDIKVPNDLRVNLVRVAMDDPRDRESSDWSGELLEGAPPAKVYDWQWSASYGSRIDLEALSGAINLAARVRLLFFKKTFRKRLFDWTGYTHSFFLAGEQTDGHPLRGDILFGTYADPVAFAEIPRLAGNEVINSPDMGAKYPGVLGNEECVVIRPPR